MSLRLKLTLLLSILFLTAIGNAVFTFILEGYEEEKLTWVIHTHEVINESASLLSAMTDAETGQRGYLLTKVSSYLEPYHTGIAAAEAHINALAQLTLDNPKQQKRLVTVRELMTKKFAELNATIALMQENTEESAKAALDIVMGDSGKQYMDVMRMELVAFNNEEQLLLEKRKGDFRASRAYVTTMVGIEIVFFLFMGLITALFIKDKLFSPMAMLLESTSKMERGEKQNIVNLLPDDEMGYLLSRFYQMSEKVYDKTAELTYQAAHDSLTSLKNRSGIEKEIRDSVAVLTKNNAKIAVLLIDLNKFKQLNDTLGHSAGDEVLKETANRLKDSVRSYDAVFRLGGDEFIIVIKDIFQVSLVQSIVVKIIKKFASPFMFHGNPIDISLSIGIAISPDDSTKVEKLLKFADIAMYAAKTDTKANYKFFDRVMLKRGSDDS